MSVLEFPPGMDPDYAVNRLYLDELMKEVTAKLTDIKARMVTLGIPVESYVATGIPSAEVSDAAQTHEAELIVVGTRGRPASSISCWEVRPSELYGWRPVPF